MARFNVGDLVRVVDEGERYPGYDGFFESNNAPYDMAMRYAYGAKMTQSDFDGRVFEVIFHGRHEKNGSNIYLIRELENKRAPIYMFTEFGLKPAKRNMYRVPIHVEADVFVEAWDEDDADNIVFCSRKIFTVDEGEVDIESLRIWNDEARSA